ncbi:MAG: Fe2+-dependent dioxygenase [Gammaproteobacteria bacterium]|nr:Fe2+-dependent dioxygenase [Gammaproteobacteria bacterium]
MLLQIPGALSAEQVAQCRRSLAEIDWIDGRATAGHLSMSVKHNDQIREDHPVAARLGRLIQGALEQNPLFVSGALPAKIVPPIFNRYSVGQSYGPHIDGSIRSANDGAGRIRTDVSATLFLCEPDEYDGGELLIEDTYGSHSVKWPAGHLVLYPASSVHQVRPVTRGTRIAAFFWIQSMVREDARRRMLFDLDQNIQRLRRDVPEHGAALELTALYHNLMREWAEV